MTADAWARTFFDAHDAPAMAFAVARNGDLLWSAAHGQANLELGVPARTDHRFRLGSVSKVITTTTAARLVSRGLIELDTPIAYWLPDVPEHHRQTTLRQLFTHTGGVRHYGPQDLDPAAPGGFRAVSWDHALDRVAGEIRRIQQAHGPDAFAVLSGVSLSNEKSYLMGKFARLGVGTANLDYNGRLCMVSAGKANMMALGMDRASNPWSDIPLADVVFLAGTNVAECSPITTDYIWRARDRGAKLIMIDPRVTPLARTADLYIPVRPGGDSALMNGILHVVLERGWANQEFIDSYTTGFDSVKEAVAKYTPEVAGELSGVDPELIVRAAEMWGPAKTSMPCSSWRRLATPSTGRPPRSRSLGSQPTATGRQAGGNRTGGRGAGPTRRAS